MKKLNRAPFIDENKVALFLALEGIMQSAENWVRTLEMSEAWTEEQNAPEINDLHKAKVAYIKAKGLDLPTGKDYLKQISVKQLLFANSIVEK